MQNETKHTRGPWKLLCEHSGENRKWIVTGKDSDFTNAYIHTPSDELRGEYLANALLIAAAPEMLAALEEVINDQNLFVGDFQHDEVVLSKARAAIAKAKGTQ